MTNAMTSHERALMNRSLALGESVARFLREVHGITPGDVDLVGVGLVAVAARRELTAEARLCELQAMVRRWAREPEPPTAGAPAQPTARVAATPVRAA